VLTGGPAVGKSTCARALAAARPRSAVVDVDDLRQLVVGGAAAPWEGAEGRAQLLLGAANASALATRFTAAGFETVIADVLTPDSAAVYRDELAGCLLVHLRVSMEEALRRAATRTVYLTDAEFRWVHDQDAAHPPDADVVLEVDGWSVAHQVSTLEAVWADARVDRP
jgi:hypothetical protein